MGHRQLSMLPTEAQSSRLNTACPGMPGESHGLNKMDMPKQISKCSL